MKMTQHWLRKMNGEGQGFGFLGHAVRRPAVWDSLKNVAWEKLAFDAYDITRAVDQAFIAAANLCGLNPVEAAVWADSKSGRHTGDELLDAELLGIHQPLSAVQESMAKLFAKRMKEFYASKEANMTDFYHDEQVEWGMKLGIDVKKKPSLKMF